MSNDQNDSLNERLCRLERECGVLKRRARRWRLIGGVAVIGVIVLTVGGGRPADDMKVVEAERISLKDKDGRERVRIGIEPDGSAGQVFMDKRGKPRLGLGVGSDGSVSIDFLGEDEKPRLSMALEPNGRTGLLGYDKEGDLPMLDLGVQPDGFPFQCFFDKDGRQRMSFQIDPNGEPGLFLWDGDKKVRSKLP